MPEPLRRGHRLLAVALVSIQAFVLLPSARASAAGGEFEHRQWTTADGLPHNSITAIAQDRRGYLWLGTVEGLVRFDGENFTVFDTGTTPELLSNFINALLATEEGGLWIGTRRGLNYYMDGSFDLYTEADGLIGEVVSGILADPPGAFLVGTDNGLCRFEDGRFEEFEANDELSGKTIYSLALDPGGGLWIGTAEGLSLYSRGSAPLLDPVDDLADEFILSLAMGPGQELWAGTLDGGLRRIDPVTRKTLENGPEVTSPMVFSLVLGSRDALWIGTRSGLKRARGDVSQHIPEVGSDSVMSLFEGSEERLWIGTFQTGLHSLQRVDETSREKPRLVIESVSVQHREPLAPREIVLPKGRADIEFRFTAIDYRRRRSDRFRYFLEGYDAFWVDAGSQRHAAYTNLPPGSYRFRVRGGQGRDPSSEAAYAFQVPARFHQTPVFRLLIVLASASILWGLFLWRVRQLLQTRLHLQQQIAIQTEEILSQRDQLQHFHRRLDQANLQLQQTNRELKSQHREKSDFLAIVTHDLRAPLVNLKGFAAELRHSLRLTRELLEPSLETLTPEGRENTRRALQLDGPEALAFIEGSAKKMEEVIGPILKMSRLTRQPLKIQPVSLNESLEQALVKLKGDLQASGALLEIEEMPGVLADSRALEEIFFQLLANALSSLEEDRPGRIEIRSRRGDQETVVSVRDNGRPAKGKTAARPFQLLGRRKEGVAAAPERGLGFARVLVQRHGGKIWHSSNLSIGSTFYFSIPRKPSPFST